MSGREDEGCTAAAAPAPLCTYPDLMTVNHMAKILDITPRNVYRLVEKDALPCVRVGKRIYFPKPRVLAFLDLGEG
jgi:excisionase family DNA binding protein